MNNTYQILLHWDKGQPFSERLSSKILDIEGFQNIDPQCPTGGPDGTKDIVCWKDSIKYVAACYFSLGQKSFSEIENKFNDDYIGVEKNSAKGFVFLTNQKLTPSERIKLIDSKDNCLIYHLEKICGILDSPRGYGIRLEFLDIELSKEEQISYLNAQLDLKKQNEQITELLNDLKKVTVNVAGLISEHDFGQISQPIILPIAGLQFSSRLSIEDLQAIHLSCLYGSDLPINSISHGFRNVKVWIGSPGCSIEKAEYLPPDPEDIPTLIYELLLWWREEYNKVIYANNEKKKIAIAKFHEKFLSIHPFIDGNGRVSRIIASIHYKDLLNKIIVFDKIENTSEYYDSLIEARKGNYLKLANILDNLSS